MSSPSSARSVPLFLDLRRALLSAECLRVMGVHDWDELVRVSSSAEFARRMREMEISSTVNESSDAPIVGRCGKDPYIMEETERTNMEEAHLVWMMQALRGGNEQAPAVTRHIAALAASDEFKTTHVVDCDAIDLPSCDGLCKPSGDHAGIVEGFVRYLCQYERRGWSELGPAEREHRVFAFIAYVVRVLGYAHDADTLRLFLTRLGRVWDDVPVVCEHCGKRLRRSESYEESLAETSCRPAGRTFLCPDCWSTGRRFAATLRPCAGVLPPGDSGVAL